MKADGEYGNFCSLKCVPRRRCGGCLNPLSVLDASHLLPTDADSKRHWKITRLTELLALRPKVEAVAAAPKCCWRSIPFLNHGELSLKDEPCAECARLPVEHVRGFQQDNKDIWSEDWPAVQKELEGLRAVPDEPPLKIAFKQFVCQTQDCPAPWRLADEDCDEQTRRDRKHAREMAEFHEQPAKRARVE
jgi:hypothetical protein